MSWLAAIPEALKLVPRWVWLLLAGALAWHVALGWHRLEVEAFGNGRFDAGRQSRDAEIAALQRQIDAGGAELAGKMRTDNDEKLAAVAGDADDLRLRGPGKAACPAPAVLPAAAGGRVEAAPETDAAVDPLPDPERPELIAMPFAGAVAGAEEHDALLIEAEGWREWHRRFTAWWADVQSRAAATQPEKKK